MFKLLFSLIMGIKEEELVFALVNANGYYFALDEKAIFHTDSYKSATSIRRWLEQSLQEPFDIVAVRHSETGCRHAETTTLGHRAQFVGASRVHSN